MASAQTHEKLYLEAGPRSIVGKGVRYLRKAGYLPANIYGKDYPSTAVSVKESEFRRIYAKAGKTGIVYIKLDGKEIPTLIGSIQRNPLTSWILHVDLRKINMNQKIETAVPLAFKGESPAEKSGAVLLYQMDQIAIEALPANIPSEITVDLAMLGEVGASITVGDLPKSENYEIVDDASMVIVSAVEHKEESTEPDTTTAIPETEGGEGVDSSSTAETPEDASSGKNA